MAYTIAVIETARLILRRLTTDDAEFMLALLNEPSFLQFIGDRGVRTIEDAERYILNGPVENYARLGFGLYLTVRKDDGLPIGICGLLKRPALADVDIGFAFRPASWGQGYGLESARAVMEHGARDVGLTRIVAITSPANRTSKVLLARLGLRFEEMIRLSPEADEVELHGYRPAP